MVQVEDDIYPTDALPASRYGQDVQVEDDIYPADALPTNRYGQKVQVRTTFTLQ